MCPSVLLKAKCVGDRVSMCVRSSLNVSPYVSPSLSSYEGFKLGSGLQQGDTDEDTDRDIGEGDTDRDIGDTDRDTQMGRQTGT